MLFGSERGSHVMLRKKGGFFDPLSSADAHWTMTELASSRRCTPYRVVWRLCLPDATTITTTTTATAAAADLLYIRHSAAFVHRLRGLFSRPECC